MKAVLILIAVADLLLGVLLFAVSGFILQGVNNTGPMMPEAIFYGLAIGWCFLAPLVPWTFGASLKPAAAIIIAASPVAISLLAVAI